MDIVFNYRSDRLDTIPIALRGTAKNIEMGKNSIPVKIRKKGRTNYFSLRGKAKIMCNKKSREPGPYDPNVKGKCLAKPEKCLSSFGQI